MILVQIFLVGVGVPGGGDARQKERDCSFSHSLDLLAVGGLPLAMIVYKNRAVNLKAEMEDGQIQPWV